MNHGATGKYEEMDVKDLLRFFLRTKIILQLETY